MISRIKRRAITTLLTTATVLAATQAMAAGTPADVRADAFIKQMTPDEQITLLHGIFARPDRTGTPLPQGAIPSAGYTPGIPRLNIPALQETDASLGIAWITGLRKEGGTALPSSMALAASWDISVAYAGSAAIAREARADGMNVLLAGGIDLTRDPRNGRNFEYMGEDPLLVGILGGETIRAIQDQHVLSTAKHLALNAQETGRHDLSADISEQAARESDLLAFELAIERGHPGSVMCAYNRYNSVYACENDFLLNKVLKGDWKYPGFVMSDWGAVHSTEAALSGLDRQSGESLDAQVFFGAPMAAARKSDPRYNARIIDMNHRILRSMITAGLMDTQPRPTIDVAANAEIARAESAASIVLLKNSGVLPLGKNVKNITVIGGFANVGVVSGGGSSQVEPARGPALSVPVQGTRAIQLHPSPPLAAIVAKAGPNVHVLYDDGRYPAYAAKLAAQSDVVIVFAQQWTSEGLDVPDINLPQGQDALIAAVTAANPRAIVVLETGGPVLMPWLSKTGAVLEAWFPGIKGGEAIADVLFGDVNPSGRLPITFPASLDQLPRPKLDGLDDSDLTTATFDKLGDRNLSQLHVNYDIEGSDVGYRWFARKGLTPLFPFGFGLSYSKFTYDDLKVTGGDTVHVSFRVTNSGSVAGKDVPQVYLVARNGVNGQRLVGWDKISLAPGESKTVTVNADPRLLADWSTPRHSWVVPKGKFDISVNSSAATPVLKATATINGRTLAP